MFHIVTSGSCWVQVPGEEPVELRQGSLALVPHGQGHSAFSKPEAEIKPLLLVSILFNFPLYLPLDYLAPYDVICITQYG